MLNLSLDVLYCLSEDFCTDAWSHEYNMELRSSVLISVEKGARLNVTVNWWFQAISELELARDIAPECPRIKLLWAECLVSSSSYHNFVPDAFIKTNLHYLLRLVWVASLKDLKLIFRFILDESTRPKPSSTGSATLPASLSTTKKSRFVSASSPSSPTSASAGTTSPWCCQRSFRRLWKNSINSGPNKQGEIKDSCCSKAMT